MYRNLETRWTVEYNALLDRSVLLIELRFFHLASGWLLAHLRYSFWSWNHGQLPTVVYRSVHYKDLSPEILKWSFWDIHPYENNSVVRYDYQRQEPKTKPETLSSFSGFLTIFFSHFIIMVQVTVLPYILCTQVTQVKETISTRWLILIIEWVCISLNRFLNLE